MKSNATISNSVKEVLSSVSWNHRTGTVESVEIINLIRNADNKLEKVIQVNNLNNIKHKSIPLDTLLANSLNEAESAKNAEVYLGHLLLGLLKTLGSKKYSKVKSNLNRILLQESNNKDTNQNNKESLHKELESIGLVKVLNKSLSSEEINDLVSRKYYEDKLISLANKKYKRSIILAGPSRSGKSSLIKLLVKRILKQQVPQNLKDAQVIQVDLGMLLNDSVGKSSLASKFKNYVSLKSEENTFTIFYFDNVHLLPGFGVYNLMPPVYDDFYDSSFSKVLNNFEKSFKTGVKEVYQVESSSDNTNDMRRVLHNTAFIVSTVNSSNDHFGDNPTYDLWDHVDLNIIDSHTLKKILLTKLPGLEAYYGIKIQPKVVKSVLDAASSTDSDDSELLPITLGLLDTICSSYVVQKSSYKSQLTVERDLKRRGRKKNATKYNNTTYSKLKGTKTSNNTLSVNYVQKALQDTPHINSKKTKTIFSTKVLNNLKSDLQKQIVGQNEALESITNSIKLSQYGVKDKDKPLCSVLFLGPTGVGKTQTAKSLASALYGSSSGLLRLDMSDFMEKHTVARLVGSPPGYVGFGEGGQLVDFVSNNPSSVILFDEVEKAHPDVLNILLSILQEGELTSGDGGVVKFDNTIIVLTSNLGAELIKKDSIGFLSGQFDIKQKKIEEKLKANLKKKIKPEILNRLDDIVVFNQLSKYYTKKIIQKEISKYQELVEQEHNIQVEFNSSLVNYILKNSYSNEYGVREVHRGIEKNIMLPLVNKLISSKRPKKRYKVTHTKSKVIVS